ncbi:hypothetical protein FACS189485_03550 [Spirochaetia bacterium]|nr:hypothetical protein FACS189485_03550 [Spirochaetia bacterium]
MSMEYQKTSVCDILSKIEERKYFLPAIQRKYVWEESQIIKLMDSILLGYPIGTFLFWKVEKRAAYKNGYTFYEFIKDFNENENKGHVNSSATIKVKGSGDVTAVLDGQQRLTSLYIAVYGTLALRLKGARKGKEGSYPPKKLYLNLKHKPLPDDEITYQFKFLTADEIEENDSILWFEVKNILKFKDIQALNTRLIMKSGWGNDVTILNNITALFENIMSNENINYCEVTENSMDKILDIFIRVNSGGTVLSKTDLLFSTVVSHWADARDRVDQLLSRINKHGGRFNFDLDFIMRTSLYLLGFSVNLKVETFKKDNVNKIKDAWDDIETAIEETVHLLHEFGFCSDNITSYVAIMPIIYHRYKAGKFHRDTDEIRKYFIIAQVKQIFGASTNTTLEKIRKEVGLEKRFTVAQFVDLEFTGKTNMSFDRDDVKALFEIEKGAYTFMLLSLLYPDVNYTNHFHQDHMHPFSGFTDTKLKKIGLDESTIKDWQRKRNTLANLQLLEGLENKRKNDSTLKKWLSENNNKRKTQYLPKMSYELKDFEEFLTKRQKLMENELARILL